MDSYMHVWLFVFHAQSEIGHLATAFFPFRKLCLHSRMRSWHRSRVYFTICCKLLLFRWVLQQLPKVVSWDSRIICKSVICDIHWSNDMSTVKVIVIGYISLEQWFNCESDSVINYISLGQWQDDCESDSVIGNISLGQWHNNCGSYMCSSSFCRPGFLVSLVWQSWIKSCLQVKMTVIKNRLRITLSIHTCQLVCYSCNRCIDNVCCQRLLTDSDCSCTCMVCWLLCRCVMFCWKKRSGMNCLKSLCWGWPVRPSAMILPKLRSVVGMFVCKSFSLLRTSVHVLVSASLYLHLVLYDVVCFHM